MVQNPHKQEPNTPYLIGRCNRLSKSRDFWKKAADDENRQKNMVLAAYGNYRNKIALLLGYFVHISMYGVSHATKTPPIRELWDSGWRLGLFIIAINTFFFAVGVCVVEAIRHLS